MYYGIEVTEEPNGIDKHIVHAFGRESDRNEWVALHPFGPPYGYPYRMRDVSDGRAFVIMWELEDHKVVYHLPSAPQKPRQVLIPAPRYDAVYADALAHMNERD